MKQDSKAISFHMPGHKYRMIFNSEDFLRYDVTELPGFDNLIEPEGWIWDLTDRISSFYNSRESRISVGGSTAGILSSILGGISFISEKKACSQSEIRALIARNSHISVFNALEMTEAEVSYLDPVLIGDIPSHFDMQELRRKAQNIDLFVIPYPFYQGSLYDLPSILHCVRECNPDVVVIVDEAHGAHLRLEEIAFGTSISALSQGADIVIQSLHKTLPALGSAAIVHYGKTSIGAELLHKKKELFSVEWYLKALQTTSPSFLILESIFQMMEILETNGVKKYLELKERIDRFYEHTKQVPFDYRGYARQDRSKILLPLADQRYFTDRNIFPEMVTHSHILFLSSIANTDEDFFCLEKAVSGYSFGGDELKNSPLSDSCLGSNRKVLRYGSSRRKKNRRGMSIPAFDAQGLRSAETLVVYPPGSPVIVEGELFTSEVCELLGKTEVFVYTGQLEERAD